MDHTCPYDSARCSPLPDGVSRFQYPGLARSLTVYCVNGLVFLCRGIWVPRAGTHASHSPYSQPLFTDLSAMDAPAPLRHDPLPHQVALRAIAAIVVTGAVIIRVAIVGVAVAIRAVIAGAHDAPAPIATPGQKPPPCQPWPQPPWPQPPPPPQWPPPIWPPPPKPPRACAAWGAARPTAATASAAMIILRNINSSSAWKRSTLQREAKLVSLDHG